MEKSDKSSKAKIERDATGQPKSNHAGGSV